MMNINRHIFNLFGIIKKHGIYLFGYITITLLTIRDYFSHNLPAGTDTFGYIARVEFFTYNKMLISIWDPSSFGLVRMFNIDNLLTFLNLLLKNSVLIVKIFIFLMILFSGINMYYVIYKYIKDENIAFISGLLYSLNFWFMGKITIGHLNHALAYTLFPLIFISYDKLLKEKSIKTVLIFSSFFTFLLIFSRADITFYIAFFLFIYTIYFILFSSNKKQQFIKVSKITILCCIIIFLFSAYQFIPTIFGSKPAYFSLTEKFAPIEHLKSWSINLHKTMIGFTREVGYQAFLNGVTYLSHPIIPRNHYYLFASMFCILAFLSLIFKTTRSIKLFLSISALIFIFLAKGPHQPLGGIYLWIYNNIPFSGSLRAPTRWVMFVWFIYSFLIGLLLANIFRKFNKYKKIIIIFLLILIILIFYIPISGLKTWHPPNQVIVPHLWLNDQKGDFRVATVPYSQSYMNTKYLLNSSIGWWEQDIGSDSFFYHKKPVIGTGGWFWGLSHDFVTYTLNIIIENKTKYFMKILGTFDIKYVVLQSYPVSQGDIEVLPKGYNPYYQHTFFRNQKGLSLVFKYENNSVYENKYWTRRIFIIGGPILVIDGRDLFVDLAEIPYYHFNNTAIYFVDQIIKENGKQYFNRLYNLSNLLIFNSKLTDLSMLLINDSESIRITPARFAYPSTDSKKYWISSDYAIKRGLFVYNSRTLHTEGENTVEIPFDIKEDNYYEIWIRVLYGKNKGKLIVKIDNITKEFLPYNDFETFKWIKIGESYLNKGKYGLIIQNKKSKYGVNNDIDEIVIVKKGYVEKHLRKAEKLIEEFNGSILMFFDSEQMVFRDVANENAIIDEELLPFWMILDEKSTKYGFIKDSPKGYSYSLMLNLKGERKYYTIINYIFDKVQDWSNYTGFYIWFKGQGTGKTFFVNIYFNKSYDNWVRYTFVDDSKEWRKILFLKSDFKSTKDKIDWSKVWRIGIGSDDKRLTGKYYIGTLNAFFGEKRVLEIDVPRTDNYRMSMQVEGGGKINILVNNKTMKIFADKERVESEIFRLKKGTGKIIFTFGDNIRINRVVLYSIKYNETLKDILAKNKSAATVTYKKINPTKYIAHVKTDIPIFLIFSDSYHPLWKAYIDGKEYDSIIAYSFINSFYIPKTGEYDVIIEFTGQRYVWIGLAISITTFIFLISYIIFGGRVFKPFKHIGEKVWKLKYT